MTSWAIVDYFLRPKPAYFTIARELRPFTVGMTRKEKQTFSNERSAANFTIDTFLEIWGTNSTLSNKNAILEVTAFDLDSSWTDRWEINVILALNSSTELYKGKLPGQPERTKKSEVPKTIVVSARLLDENKTVLGRYSNWYANHAFFFYKPFSQKLLTGRSLLNLLTSLLLEILVSKLRLTKMARVSPSPVESLSKELFWML